MEKLNGLMGILAGCSEASGSKERLKPGADALSEIAGRYLDRQAFRPGDVVMYKKGLKNTKFPDYGEPAVALEMRPGNVTKNEDGDSSCYLAPRDLRIGLYGPLDSFEGFWVDSARFELWVDDSPVDASDSAGATATANEANACGECVEAVTRPNPS